MTPRIPHPLDNGQSLDTTTPSATTSPSLITYVVAVQGPNVTYLHCSSGELFLASRSTVPPEFEPGKLYCLSWNLASPGESAFSPLTDRCFGSYLHRGDYAFTGARFDNVVLRSLILGCRIRDFEQRCATVTQRSPLAIKIPWSYEDRRPIERFFTDTGEAVDLRVDNYSRCYDGKSSVLFGSPVSTLPSGLAKNSRLHQADTGDGTTLVTTALERFTRYDNDIINRPLLDRIYGKAGSFDYAPVEHALVTMQRKDGDCKLSADRSEAVWRYKSESPGFVVEEASGPGRLMTISAMVTNFTGPGLQLILSTGNAAAFTMANMLAGIKNGNKIGHLVASDKVNKYKKMRSPFVITEKEYQHVSLDGTLSVIIATVYKLLDVLLKERVAGDPCPLQELLMTKVRRIVVNEGNQMPEAALIALILLFPLATIVVVGHPEDPKPLKYTKGDVGSKLAARPALDAFMRKTNLPTIRIRSHYVHHPSRSRNRDAPPTLHRPVNYSNYEHYALLSSLNMEYSHRAAQPRVGDRSSAQPAPPPPPPPTPAPRFCLASLSSRIASYCENVTHDARRSNGFFKEEDMAALHCVAMRLRVDGYANDVLDVVYYTDKLVLVRMPLREMKARLERTKYEAASAVSPNTAALFSSKKSLKDKETGLVILGSEAIRRTAPWQQLVANGNFVAIASPASK